MTEFITRNYGNENFEIIIKTDSKEYYEATQDFARQLIDHAKPTIEAKPVVHAHWISKQEAENIDRYDLVYCCSACGRCDWDYIESNSFKYCPACGAQMDESISRGHENYNHIAGTGKKGVKIPVISMEDVPKVMEEMEK